MSGILIGPISVNIYYQVAAELVAAYLRYRICHAIHASVKSDLKTKAWLFRPHLQHLH